MLFDTFRYGKNIIQLFFIVLMTVKRQQHIGCLAREAGKCDKKTHSQGKFFYQTIGLNTVISKC